MRLVFPGEGGGGSQGRGDLEKVLHHGKAALKSRGRAEKENNVSSLTGIIYLFEVLKGKEAKVYGAEDAPRSGNTGNAECWGRGGK